MYFKNYNVRLIICLLALPCIFSSFNIANKQRNKPAFEKGFAVVELFTSEGCSSCPPADDAVGRLEGQAKNIYVLSFHVDYWNYLGWKDKYSNASYSGRQQQYGAIFHIENIYTPQIVVNGKIQFVGSNETQLKESISASVAELPDNNIQIKVSQADNHKIPVSIISNGDAKLKLNVALVQNFAKDFIQRGENKGKTLSHFFIVRDFKVSPNQNNAKMYYLDLPDDLKSADCSVVAFLQNPVDGHITAATGSSIP
ncbi:MAG TPA: DUF1223 domain-containing protein [Puia sp.]|jgi:hypothetical protein|nr:DUF1223 domain-containing protein [Puia sp.]